MHPTAPSRQCYQENINEYFICLTCESSIAREEQCVHSVNTNDFVFIPEQFASYYFRRKLVSGSYISMGLNESGNNMNHNDTNSNDESMETENDSLGLKIADSEYSIDQQEGTFFCLGAANAMPRRYPSMPVGSHLSITEFVIKYGQQ